MKERIEILKRIKDLQKRSEKIDEWYLSGTIDRAEYHKLKRLVI